MPRGLDPDQCSCGRYGPLTCDWPMPGKPGGKCMASICEKCVLVDRGNDRCPFHRGEFPMTQAEMDAAGEAEAVKLARMFGIER